MSINPSPRVLIGCKESHEIMRKYKHRHGSQINITMKRANCHTSMGFLYIIMDYHMYLAMWTRCQVGCQTLYSTHVCYECPDGGHLQDSDSDSPVLLMGCCLFMPPSAFPGVPSYLLVYPPPDMCWETQQISADMTGNSVGKVQLEQTISHKGQAEGKALWPPAAKPFLNGACSATVVRSICTTAGDY